MSAVRLKKKQQKRFWTAVSRNSAQAAGPVKLFSPSSSNAANVTINAPIIEDDGANVMVTSEALEKGNAASLTDVFQLGAFAVESRAEPSPEEDKKLEESLEEDKFERQDVVVSEEESRKVAKQERRSALLQRMVQGFQSAGTSMRAIGASMHTSMTSLRGCGSPMRASMTSLRGCGAPMRAVGERLRLSPQLASAARSPSAPVHEDIARKIEDNVADGRK